MASVFDASALADIRDTMKTIFDTFKRSSKLRFYKVQEEEIVMFDPSYNADFQELTAHNDSVTMTSQYEEFDARIIYLDRQEGATFLGGGEELNVKTRQFYGRIKIQLEQDGYDYIKDSQRIVFLGNKYQIEDDVRNIGTANEFQFYSFNLIKIP
jgi:hypothetical protein